MDDRISREEALNTIKSMLYQTALNNMDDEKAAQLYEDIADNRIETWLKLVDSVDAAPVEHGQWQEVHTKARGYGKVWYQHNCSPILYESPYYYCPFCGAKIGEKKKET